MSDEEFVNKNLLDNSELEKLIRQDETPESEVLEELSKSRLIMPIELGLEDYSIRYLTDDDGNNAVLLFTNGELMLQSGEKSSVMALPMSDLAEILKETDDCSQISINPGTEIELNVPVDVFLDLF